MEQKIIDCVSDFCAKERAIMHNGKVIQKMYLDENEVVKCFVIYEYYGGVKSDYVKTWHFVANGINKQFDNKLDLNYMLAVFCA